MLENIKKLKGVQKITPQEQQKINGGNRFDICFFIACSPGTLCVNGRCI